MDARDFNLDEVRRKVAARSPVSLQDYIPGHYKSLCDYIPFLSWLFELTHAALRLSWS